MNTKFRIFRTVLLSAALTLSLLSCSDSTNGTDEAEVTPSSSSAVSPPQGEQGFEKNAQVYWQDGTPFTDDLDVLFNGAVLNKIQAGKYTLALPTDEQVASILVDAPSLKESICPTVTSSASANTICDIEVSSQTAKSLSFEPVANLLNGESVRLRYTTGLSDGDDGNGIAYLYVTEAVTVTGSVKINMGTASVVANYDIQLQKGWARVLLYAEENGANATMYITSDLSKMKDFNLKWMISANPEEPVLPSSSAGPVEASSSSNETAGGLGIPADEGPITISAQKTYAITGLDEAAQKFSVIKTWDDCDGGMVVELVEESSVSYSIENGILRLSNYFTYPYQGSSASIIGDWSVAVDSLDKDEKDRFISGSLNVSQTAITATAKEKVCFYDTKSTAYEIEHGYLPEGTTATCWTQTIPYPAGAVKYEILDLNISSDGNTGSYTQKVSANGKSCSRTVNASNYELTASRCKEAWNAYETAKSDPNYDGGKYLGDFYWDEWVETDSEKFYECRDSLLASVQG
jgi:hypothetical protein